MVAAPQVLYSGGPWWGIAAGGVGLTAASAVGSASAGPATMSPSTAAAPSPVTAHRVVLVLPMASFLPRRMEPAAVGAPAAPTSDSSTGGDPTQRLPRSRNSPKASGIGGAWRAWAVRLRPVRQ